MDMVRVMVCNVTFNNIAVISWQSVLVVETLPGGESPCLPCDAVCNTDGKLLNYMSVSFMLILIFR
jgi:hypothetical protein